MHQPDYIVFPRRENPSNHIHTYLPSSVGYLHYTSVNGDRRRLYEAFPGPMGTLNYVGARVCQKQLHRTIPKDWTEDPYFVCHLLALAQSEDRKLGLSRLNVFTVCPKSIFSSRPLGTHSHQLIVVHTRDQRPRSREFAPI